MKTKVALLFACVCAVVAAVSPQASPSWSGATQAPASDVPPAYAPSERVYPFDREPPPPFARGTPLPPQQYDAYAKLLMYVFAYNDDKAKGVIYKNWRDYGHMFLQYLDALEKMDIDPRRMDQFRMRGVNLMGRRNLEKWMVLLDDVVGETVGTLRRLHARYAQDTDMQWFRRTFG